MTAVFVVVVGARFLVPLLIPRFPLPGVIACLVLDALDQTIFQAFGYDPPGYQGYDKAMDVYYLAIAYLATLRNWTSSPAFVVGRFLYFYRLVGVVAFELTQTRALLLIFPNTFEYFFIAYEAVRTRWNNIRIPFKGWVLAAAFIWIFIKLPQEYWIHIAQRDVTDTAAEIADDLGWSTTAFWVAFVVAVLAILAIVWLTLRRRVPEPDWSFRIAADTPPQEMDEESERVAWRQQYSKVLSGATLEKVALISLLSVIFAQTVPGVQSTNLELAVGIGALVVVNSAISLAAARRDVTIESAIVVMGIRLVLNFALVMLASLLIGPADVNEGAAVFFLAMLSLLTTLHDRWLPVRHYRAGHETPYAARPAAN